MEAEELVVGPAGREAPVELWVLGWWHRVPAEVEDSKRERARKEQEKEEKHHPLLACQEGMGREEQGDGRRVVGWSPGQEMRRGAGLEPPGTGWKEEAEK